MLVEEETKSESPLPQLDKEFLIGNEVLLNFELVSFYFDRYFHKYFHVIIQILPLFL